MCCNNKMNGKYHVHSYINSIDAYEQPHDGSGNWELCPHCGIKPEIWSFNNGRSTACGCWNDEYDRFSIHAESVISVHNRTGGLGMNEYDSDALRKNWNHWCLTGEILFEHASKRTDGRW